MSKSSDTLTISRKKIKQKSPVVVVGKRDFYYLYYVDRIPAGRTSGQVHDYISRMRHEAGHFDTPSLTVVKEACDLAAFSDATIIRMGRAWVCSIE